MNFFERQDAARKGSRAIGVVFVLAVVCIVLAVDGVVAVAWAWASAGNNGPTPPPRGLFMIVTLGVIATIVTVSLVKMAMLRAGGGAAVAGMLGARRVEPNTKDP